jgi:hypothetical protein
MTTTTAGRLPALCLAFLLAPAVALAQGIDLSKPYGNEAGCKNGKGQGPVTDEMIFLTDTTLTTATSTCTFVQKISAADGTMVATSLCTLEGEEGRAIVFFSVAPSKANPQSLVISDEYGAAFDEITACP